MSTIDVLLAAGNVLAAADAELNNLLNQLDSAGTTTQDVADIAAQTQAITNTISAASQVVSTANAIDQKLAQLQTS